MIRSIASVPEHYLKVGDRCISAIGTLGTIIETNVKHPMYRGEVSIIVQWENGSQSNFIPSYAECVEWCGR